MVIDYGLEQSFPIVRCVAGAAMLWLGLNIIIISKDDVTDIETEQDGL